ncbi:winged helix DNA-binding domain-containing protein [Flavitalea sp. BT771]|uniref:winged helix DNA-binding domain-containing protein n=1 Tax=Flavitalea sp. BT771 TaxID=3063329 RepID=UPI0026E243E7|nr:winged helix DNA-binding domain-containing protein [Flavitalea sp. BT771]MDO6434912.1 winged helix DNA-binding domain-containing protein [Flavitalea sp. BT771]MDV6223812.1 winged helix DNA-binding domain-containing protein [Flavitalea sp. BT771]
MTSKDISQLRLVNQRLAGTAFTTPHQLVKWMGCIQAQDYAMAKWAVGCRLQQATDATVENDFNEGKFLRTHVLRPTWHFISPEDIRWMLKLSAPRIRAFARPYHRQLDIDAAVLRKSKKIITKALSLHKKLTREQLTEALRKEKIDTTDTRMGHLLIDAELDALICSAGRIGKQFAYGLLDEHAPQTRPLTDEEAIAELSRIYFLSRGPATIQDFAWWGGLTLTDARKGLNIYKQQLGSVSLNGNEYWFSPASLPDTSPATSTFLLPAFDEYTVAYKFRNDVLNPEFAAACNSGLNPILVHNTLVAGTWRRTEKKDGIHIENIPFPRTRIPARPLTAAAKKYTAFMGKTLINP